MSFVSYVFIRYNLSAKLTANLNLGVSYNQDHVEEGRDYLSIARQKKTQQRPTFPRGRPRSIISAEGLNCRVRNGNGWDPFAIVTG